MPREPLVRAAHSDDIDALKQLLVGKPNPNVRDKHSHTTALEHAIFNANREILQLLLTAGADVNLRDSLGQTPIMMLGEKITPEIVWDLIRAGAKVNLRDQEGNTALIEAGACNNLEVLKALLEAGAKVDARNNVGETALMRAASEGLVNNVRALILAGEDVNARDGEGRTALMRALENEHRPVLRLLRSYGVDESMQPTKAAAQP
jgi:ankyrin repeat protein